MTNNLFCDQLRESNYHPHDIVSHHTIRRHIILHYTTSYSLLMLYTTTPLLLHHFSVPISQMHILRFHEMVDVASSKAKPKTLTLTTTCGKALKFLCKQEKDGDLRKDARMMDFNTTLNRILQEDPEGRKRNLRLRTYSVTCLNEECGLLEWVENTSCTSSQKFNCFGVTLAW